MRWKLFFRRLSVSAPRMIVRSHLPWPLRWAVGAVAFGFSAALALWAFEFGKEIAGLDQGAKAELAELRSELGSLRNSYNEVRQVSNTAESLLLAERSAQQQLGLQLRQLEADKQALQSELAFFQRLLPTGGEGLQLRGLQTEIQIPGQLRYQMLVVQDTRGQEFKGRYEVVLAGQLGSRAWMMPLPGGARPIEVKQVARVEGTIEHPPEAVVQSVQVRIMDAKGATRATHTARL